MCKQQQQKTLKLFISADIEDIFKTIKKAMRVQESNKTLSFPQP